MSKGLEVRENITEKNKASGGTLFVLVQTQRQSSEVPTEQQEHSTRKERGYKNDPNL